MYHWYWFSVSALFSPHWHIPLSLAFREVHSWIKEKTFFHSSMDRRLWDCHAPFWFCTVILCHSSVSYMILYTWIYRNILCYFLTTYIIILHKGIHTGTNCFRMRERFKWFSLTSAHFHSGNLLNTVYKYTRCYWGANKKNSDLFCAYKLKKQSTR